ncbi:MAG: putative hydrolase of the superfamily [Solirubrobacterales bacterium]|nr:putative hydrolase of the superfamily [Solirubrobacterales bacterium]
MAAVANRGWPKYRGTPVAVTFDFWNTLVAEPGGRLSTLRRDAVGEILRAAAAEIDEKTLDRHLAAAGAVYQTAWEAGQSFHPREAAEALVRELGFDGAAAAEVAGAYLEAGRDADLTLVPGAAETVRALAAAGVRLGIVCDVGLTGSQHLRAFLERAGLLASFSGWAFSDEVGCFKPDPAIFDHVLSELAIGDPGSAMHVGDLRRTDVAGARAAGLFAVRFRGAADDRSQLLEADWVIDDFSELLQGLFP